MKRALVVFIACAASYRFLHIPLLMDEALHERQIQNFIRGDYALLPRLEMLPTFHLLFAALAREIGSASPVVLRSIALAVTFCFLGACYVFARTEDPERADGRVLQIFLLPILFPFLFLVYTDVLALALLVAGAAAVRRSRPLLACLLGTLAVCVRQNHIFWLVLLAALGREERPKWYWLVPPLGFAVLVWIHGGAAANAPGAGVPLPVHSGNIFFFLFLLPILFLPRLFFHCSRLKDRRLWALAAAVFALAYFGFSAPHPFNRFEGHLRTDLILAIENDFLARLDFSALAAAGILTLATFRFERRTGGALAACTALSLLPLALIEQRYFLPSLVFGLLLKRGDSAREDAVQVVYSAALTGVLFEGIVRGWWFP